ncbi:MAG TPA: hypothetical protein VK951_07205 [Miltoncostaeaceae bacterium]|nr:hypothetical protein [Miltoncostaeaceae bacterium]
MGARLLALAALLARKQGPKVARLLLLKGQAWLADPANEETKQALVAQLRTIAEVAGGAAGRMSARLAREVEKRKVSPAAWERDLMGLRYEIADMAPGPMREGAIEAYATQARAGVHLIGDAKRPDEARRQVVAALRAEQRMLRRDRLSSAERERALAAVEDALAACGASREVARA